MWFRFLLKTEVTVLFLCKYLRLDRLLEQGADIQFPSRV